MKARIKRLLDKRTAPTKASRVPISDTTAHAIAMAVLDISNGLKYGRIKSRIKPRPENKSV